ncbi:ATP-binding cassette domain-containing protein [Actinokineospora bangkokensis]|uniref:AAA+ ATPase domain-containing protein n=1 Tax=Actinokineospora bangkokensis TaxID=1193682 RepID=A0A1Q9LSM6_9PSEU|nr:ATP-binding cassette domain-containing protein [Actinokineospora bangkokensis]OLR95057.1 hypothetical protein BJP25_08890 [Actinokineospora bangkokensis]
MIAAENLGLRTRRGWVFQQVDLAVDDGGIVAVVGPAGSGRSMLLLSLAGRARPSTGTLSVAGETSRAAIRRLVGVARITGAVDLEPDLTVHDIRRETRLLSRGADLRRAEGDLGLSLDGASAVGDLAADERLLLAVATATAAAPRALVVDDVDLGTTREQQERVWAALRDVAAAGTAVMASALDPVVVDGVAVVELEGDDRAAR